MLVDTKGDLPVKTTDKNRKLFFGGSVVRIDTNTLQENFDPETNLRTYSLVSREVEIQIRLFGKDVTICKRGWEFKG